MAARQNPGQRRATRSVATAERVGEDVVGAAQRGGVIDGVTRVGFAAITRVDGPKREVELCATSEAVDHHGTVFDYAASKDAFTRWIGNVREMHERRAVGRRVGVRCEDATRRIYVTIRISRGAEDTWAKVLDGTLRGASIGASNVQWERQRRALDGEERELEVATRYDLVELSLVDNPSNPDALGFTFVRDATPDTALLDRLEDAEEGATETLEYAPFAADVSRERQPPRQAYQQASLWPIDAQERYQDAGAALAEKGAERAVSSAQPQAQITRIDAAGKRDGESERFHGAARAILAGCGCPLCAGALAALDDPLEPLDSAERLAGAREAIQEQAVARALGTALRASVAATSERLDRLDETLRTLPMFLRAEAERGHEQTRDLTATAGELRRRIETLEAQPLPGGPVAGMHGRPEEKRLATSNTQPGAAEQVRALESLAGRLVDPQAQLAVAAELIRLQREG